MSRSVGKIDLSEFEDFQPGPKCTVGQGLKRLEPAQVQTVAAALAAGKTSRSVAQWLSEKSGISIKEQSVARHRRGDCRCG